MRRRTLLTGAATLLAAPAIAQAATVLRFVPRYGLSVLDPIFSTDGMARVCGLAVFESLFSVDENLVPRPQMAEGYTVDPDGKHWTIKLRSGLRFHDGEPVLARDCVASILRWMKRDLVWRTFAPRLDALEAADDRTVVFRLNKPIPDLAFALGKPLTYILPIMPERLAATDATKPVPELIGSGPFRFVGDEFSAGERAVFARNETYQPRGEPAVGTSGGRRVFVDRVEWKAISDPATTVNALTTGEVDWVQIPLADLLPSLQSRPDVTVGQFDSYGTYATLRLNHLQGPTANKMIRQAIMAAIDPVEVMQAVTGNAASQFTAPIGLFVPGSPSANSVGFDRFGGHRDAASVKAMLHAAGYDGERLVALDSSDTPSEHTEMQVVVAQLRAVGMNVDDVATDMGTTVQRRNSKEPLDKGGWSMFTVNSPGALNFDPLVSVAVRTGAAAWIGWPQDERMEQLRTAWIETQDEGERRKLAEAIQQEGFDDVVSLPLGRFFQPSAWRSNVTGILKSVEPLFWNVRKT